MIGEPVRRRLVVREARTHNLRGFDVELPHDALVVVTGPSGSGKSSLAFATIHAESVRRFLSASRSGDADAAALARMPDVAAIDGLGVTLGLSQRGVVRSPRTSVATLAGVAAPIRRMFSAFARPPCPACGGETERHDVERAAAELARLPEGTRLTIVSNVARGDVGDGRETLGVLARAGFVRARIDGTIVALADVSRLRPDVAHVVDAVVDRVVVRATERDRLREAIELAYRTGGEGATVLTEGGEERTFSPRPRCVDCGALADALPDDAFRPESPAGACPRCAGTGHVEASVATVKPRARGGRASRESGASDDDDERSVDASTDCPACSGLGLLGAALGARVAGRSFLDVETQPVADLATFCDEVRARVPAARAIEPILLSIAAASAFLVDVGLGHLALARRATTLSNGELARVRLAGLLANELTGIVYVLDEPTAGLHPSERPAIIRAMRRLVDRGNTVICVEHDVEVVRACDHVVELGEGAGPSGGRLVASAALSALPSRCLTRSLLDGTLDAAPRSPRSPRGELSLVGLSYGPFRGLDVRFPRGVFTVVTGVSGSGKTTLLGRLAAAHASVLAGEPPVFVREAPGFEAIARTVRLDDTTTVAGPRALVVTRLGMFRALRDLFAALPEARAKGFEAGRFALHAAGGRCEACAGTGRALATGEAAAVDAPCDRCEGRRYDAATLSIRYRGLSFADVLDGTVLDSIARFEAIPAIHEPLSQARRLGLEYLQLGRPLRGLSGGESQRLRLAAELAGKSPAKTLYLLDEPSRGLHSVDATRLFHALDELVEAGATVIAAEHSLDAMVVADHLLDLGVDARRNTEIVDAGHPSLVATRRLGPTGIALGDRVDLAARRLVTVERPTTSATRSRPRRGPKSS